MNTEPNHTIPNLTKHEIKRNQTEHFQTKFAALPCCIVVLYHYAGFAIETNTMPCEAGLHT